MDTLYIFLYAGGMLFAITLGCVRNYYREEIDIRTRLGSPISSLSSLEDLET